MIPARNALLGEVIVEMEDTNTAHGNKDESKAPIIFPLSPDPDLAEMNKLPQFHIYHKYLEQAFQESRIHNIAITGGFGIGKSSIVRSFEQSRRKKKLCIYKEVITAFFSKSCIVRFGEQIRRKKGTANKRNTARKDKKRNSEKTNKEPGFLYISLGSFASTPDRDGNTGENPRENEKDDSQELNIIERRLLLQIYARFHQQDIPLSSFRLIPEDFRMRRIIAVVCGFITCFILLLLFHGVLGQLLVILSADRPLNPVLDLMVSLKPYLHLLLYGVVIAAASVAVAVICSRVLPRLRLSSIALKSSNAEVALEKGSSGSYLDLYSMELVYCLEQLVDKIDGTIVFEDFDRLSPNIYIQIFTRLREINYQANLRLNATDKHIRFIYVINDRLLGDIIHPKFFDYLLPVVPYLNQKSAETVLLERLKTINAAVGFGEISIRNVERVVFQLAPYLADFRLMNTVLNEYSLLSELYKDHNAENLDDDDAAHLFAFAIYKNVWPHDYQDLLLEKSRVFGRYGLRCPDDMENYDLLKLLTDPKKPLLTSHCLYYAGFSERAVANMRRSRWENGASPEEIIRDIETIQAAEHNNLDLVREYCTSAKDHKVVAAAIRCMVRCGQKDNSWFFNKNGLKRCLHILAEMEEESVKKEFFALTTARNPENIYAVSPLLISELHDITTAELFELCRGIKQFPVKVSLRVDGKLEKLSEDHPSVKQIRGKIQVQTNANY